jgi:hypothetical protein
MESYFMKSIIATLFISIIFFSCVPVEPSPDENPEDSNDPEETVETDFEVPLKWSEVADSAEWDISLRKALDKHGKVLMNSIPADIDRFSKNYKNLDYFERMNFWAYLISMMAKKESNWKPETSYVESFNDSQGNKVVSRGLLQISIESARGYDCPLERAEDLHDPELNLICTVLIMSRWVERDKVISKQDSSGKWLGGARYWSVLRKETHIEYFSGDTLALF